MKAKEAVAGVGVGAAVEAGVYQGLGVAVALLLGRDTFPEVPLDRVRAHGHPIVHAVAVFRQTEWRREMVLG